MKRAVTATVAAMMMTAAVQAQTPANQPSGRDIFLKSLHATGADTIMPKHKTMKMTGTLGIPEQGVNAPMENSRSAAGAFHLIIDITGFGQLEQGYAEGTAYTLNPASGPAILTGSAAAGSRRQALWLDVPEAYTSITNNGMAKFQDKDVWKVTMVTPDSLTLIRYFDPTTGLAVGNVVTQDMGQGPMEVTSVFSDYKDFGGMKFPSKQAQTTQGQEVDFNVDKIEFDNVPDTKFALPPEIKAIKK